MIRFSAALVVAAIGVLIGGVATSSLLLVYVAIGISALALVVLAVGVALKREELFGDEARSATSRTPERAGQSAGLPEAQQELPSQASGSQVPQASGATAHGSVFSRNAAFSSDDMAAPQSRGTDRSADAGRFPGQPGAWPPVEPGFPSAPATTADASSVKPPRSRRPAAPPTRADPVLPWADALPTRVTIAQGDSPEAVPAWLDEDDQPADVPAGTPATKPAGSGESEPDLAAEAERPVAVPAGAATSAADTLILKTMPSAAALSDDVTGTLMAEPEPSGTAPDAEADSLPAAEASGLPDGTQDADEDDAATSQGAADPADLTDAAVEVPDPEPEALSSLDAGSGDDQAPAEGHAAGDEPADDDGSGLGRRLSGTEQVTVVPGVPRYHVSDCILIRFMDDEDVQRMTADEAEQAGCTPCRACQPED